MKFTQVFLALSVGAIALTACKNEGKVASQKEESAIATAKTEVAPENLETASFTIEGMTCAMGCAATIEKKLNEADGVATAKVDFETKTATLSFDKTRNDQTSLTKIVEAVADGKTYKVTNFKKA